MSRSTKPRSSWTPSSCRSPSVWPNWRRGYPLKDVADAKKKSVFTEAHLKSLCRSYTEANIRKLAGFANAEQGVEPEIQMRAIGMLMDRGWGKPHQPHDAKVDGELRVVIRKMLREDE